MKNKVKNKILLLFVILLGITIGFAGLATTLKITGSTNIGKNTWNIYWDNVANEDGVTPSTHPQITADANNVPKSLLTWTVTLDKPGDFYEFEVDAVNAGTLDAEIIGIESKYGNSSIISTVNGALVVADPNPVPSYIKYSIKYANGNEVSLGDRLPKATVSGNTSTPTRKTYKIRVEYDRNVITNAILNGMAEPETHTFTYNVSYGQASPAVPEDFETDEWDVIASAGPIAAEQPTVTNGKCGAYTLGDTRTLDMGSLGVHTVRLANCSTPPECSTAGFSQTACGFVLEFTDIISNHMMNPNSNGPDINNGYLNVGGWKYSEMRAYLNGGSGGAGLMNYTDSSSVYGHIPEAIRSKISLTTVVSGHGKNDSENFTTQDKLYLLTPTEVVGLEGDYSTYDELDKNSTRQLDYYNYVGVRNDQDHTYVSKNYNNVASDWWCRTASGNNANDFFRIYERENWTIWDYRLSYEELGVSPAFKFSSN